jgi:hypothetical protein
MALKLFRRHRKECEGSHPEDARSGEFEEGRRGWKRCACIIHVSGTLSGKFNRKQTGKSDWDEAKAVAEGWEKAGSWTRGVPGSQHRDCDSRARPYRADSDFNRNPTQSPSAIACC